MHKTLLITGSTAGIGLETAKLLAADGHTVLLHGRSAAKVEAAKAELKGLPVADRAQGFVADLSDLRDVRRLAREVAEAHPRLDALINNAGVFATRETRTPAGLDVRFVVNTIAPYLLTKELLPQLDANARVVNLSSAAQSPVDLAALEGQVPLGDGPAYAQSKLALTMWTRALAGSLGDTGPLLVAVNPGSMLGTKMVKEAYGVAGADVRIGADILRRAALSEEFAGANGQYFDNDVGRFAPPHPAGQDDAQCAAVVRAIEGVLERMG